MFDLNFDSQDLQHVSHPRNTEVAKKIVRELKARGLSFHIILFSSGTTSHNLKGYAISLDALKINAQAVNNFFHLTSADIWGLSIPYFHVGGLSVLVRAHLLQSKIIDLGIWEPLGWHKKMTDSKVTITTVVPTQVFDLVSHKLRAPEHLKYLIVGGDFLSHELERQARNLGWPIIRTFGMTEVSSQLASAPYPGAPLEILPIHQVKTDDSGRLWVKSPALFTLEFRAGEALQYIEAIDLLDSQGYFPTNDHVQISGKFLTHLGRLDDQIKVAGKLTSPFELKEKLYSFALKKGLYGKVELQIEKDERRGHNLFLYHLPGINTEGLIPLFSPLKITLKEVPSFERTDLGKLKRL